MKPIIFILSIYFMLLALFPCNCNSLMVDINDVNMKLISSNHSENDADHEHGLCNPFCSCTNFHNPKVVLLTDFIFYKNNILIKKFQIQSENKTISFPVSIWRPPKI